MVLFLKKIKHAAMFGFCRELRKQFGELFLVSRHREAPKGANGSFKATRAAMFGLDARIALVILGVVSLSIGLSQEKKTYKEKEQEIKQFMHVFESKFLKHYKDILFAGYYILPSGYSDSYLKTSMSDVPGYGKEDKVVKFTRGSFYQLQPISDVMRTKTGQLYTNKKLSLGIYDSEVKYKQFLGTQAFKLGYFNIAGDFVNTYAYTLGKDGMLSFIRTLSRVAKDEGSALFESYSYIRNSFYYGRISKERDPLGKGIYIYVVLEYNVDANSASDYIMHVVLHSWGKNGINDTGDIDTIEKVDKFAGPQGDDIVHIFNTKDIYLQAKAENTRRLEEIREKLMSMAQTKYSDRVNECLYQATLPTPSSQCDLDNDRDYDIDDKNLLLDYNPFLKSILDTSSAKYYDTSTYFYYDTSSRRDYRVESFLSQRLGLPKYYAYGLFGNVLNYQSNVGLKTKGPYTMEVWY